MIRRLLPLICPLALLASEAPPAAPAGSPAAPAAQPPVEQILSVPEPGRFKPLFQPLRTDTAALSPDGKFIAYSVREGESLSVMVVEIDNASAPKAKIEVITDRAATPMLDPEQKEKTPGMIRWMRWVTPNRLVVETNQVFARTNAESNWQSWRGAVIGFNADGTDARLLATPNDITEFAEDPTTSFSVARNQKGTFLGTLPSEAPVPEKPLDTPPGADPFSSGEDAAAGEPPPANLGATTARTFRIFDFDPDRPDAVTMLSLGAPRAMDNRGVGYHSLNVLTGKLTDLTDDIVSAKRATLIDRQGHVRLTLPNSLLSNYPFRYEYTGPKGRTRAKPLDDTTGLTGFTVSPDNFFGERSIPLGFDRNPEILYFASNVGRDTYGVYSINLATKERGKVAIENPAFDLIGMPASGFAGQDSLVFDRHNHQLAGVRYERALRTTAWLRPALKSLQEQLEKLLPGRGVEILEWDATGNRFLVGTEGPADPGAYYVFDRTRGRLMEFARRAPWVDEQRTHATLPFSFLTSDGARISGLVTAPKQPRMKPIPMVVLCSDFPWQRVHSDFQTEVQALADMGFAVVQLNGRGAWGMGSKQRQSLTTGFDLVQVEDILVTLANLEKSFHVNPRRVALMGRGHGGFIALRALQMHPDRFRCAVAVEPPINLAEWLEQQRWTDDDAQPHLTRAWLGNAARLKAKPLVSDPAALSKPVLLFGYPGTGGAERRPGYLSARNFAATLRRHDVPAAFEDLSTDYMRGLPAARAEVFDHIEAFLNEHIYDYKVKLQDIKILPDKKP